MKFRLHVCFIITMEVRIQRVNCTHGHFLEKIPYARIRRFFLFLFGVADSERNHKAYWFFYIFLRVTSSVCTEYFFTRNLDGFFFFESTRRRGNSLGIARGLFKSTGSHYRYLWGSRVGEFNEIFVTDEHINRLKNVWIHFRVILKMTPGPCHEYLSCNREIPYTSRAKACEAHRGVVVGEVWGCDLSNCVAVFLNLSWL